MGDMTSFTCKVDRQGRILLPAKWRKENGVGPDGEVLVSVNDDRVVVQTREKAIQRIQAMVRARVRLKPGESVVDEFIAERRREARKEEKDALAWGGRK